MGPGGAVRSCQLVGRLCCVVSKVGDLLDLDLGRASPDRLPGAGEVCSWWIVVHCF